MEWYRINLISIADLSSEEVDAICCSLVEVGASGTTIEMDGGISCFVQGDAAEAERIAQIAVESGCSIVSVIKVDDENWSQRCSEVWQPVNAGVIKIVPVESLDCTDEPAPDTILIIPGQGFGTGHHPTTRMILETLSQLSAELKKRELSIFDLGTGSGILAIAAAKLFNRCVEAVDNDPSAIVNASDNVALNRLSHLIIPSTKSIEEISTPYNLILANLYGELLVKMAPDVTRLALPGCVALMSGITELVRDLVVDTYTNDHGWTLRDESADAGWHCLTLVKDR